MYKYTDSYIDKLINHIQPVAFLQVSVDIFRSYLTSVMYFNIHIHMHINKHIDVHVFIPVDVHVYVCIYDRYVYMIGMYI